MSFHESCMEICCIKNDFHKCICMRSYCSHSVTLNCNGKNWLCNATWSKSGEWCVITPYNLTSTALCGIVCVALGLQWFGVLSHEENQEDRSSKVMNFTHTHLCSHGCWHVSRSSFSFPHVRREKLLPYVWSTQELLRNRSHLSNLFSIFKTSAQSLCKV